MPSNPAREGGIVANGSIGGSLSSSVKQTPPMLPLSCDHVNTPDRRISQRTKITKKCETRGVSPQPRGRGVADRLISEVERWALETRAEVLRLAVTPGNEHATTLYRRNGFEDSGELGDLMPDGVGRERILSKKLR
jgi:GNAT superfamily N-acetyltransferase